MTGVLREALRTSGRSGFVLPGTNPEDALLRSWLLEAGIPWASPSVDALDHARRLFTPESVPLSLVASAAPLPETGSSAPSEEHGPGSPKPHDVEHACREIAGLALATRRSLLLLGTTNKTCLVLLPYRPAAPVLPLGDVYASEVLDLQGECTCPPFLRGEPQETLRAVDAALRDYFEGGYRRNEAFSRLTDPVREGVERGLDLARKRGRLSPLIPKLGRATLGMDLDL